MTADRDQEFSRWATLFGQRFGELLSLHSRQTGQHPGDVLVTGVLMDLCREASTWVDEQAQKGTP